METPQPPQNKLRVLAIRLEMAWQCLFGKKVLLFVPKGPEMLTCTRAGRFISSLEYSNIAFYSKHLQAAAQLLSEQKLLADIEAEGQRVAAIEAEISAILKP